VKPRVLRVVILIAVLTGACRQPDGAMPMPDEDVSNSIGDLGRDMQAIARGETTAKKDFADDLWGLADEDTAQQPAVLQFAERFADALASASLTEQSAQQLAHTSWLLVGATELSERQIREMQGELRSQLTSTGIPQDRVDAIVAEVPTLQRAVTTRPRRWYEIL